MPVNQVQFLLSIRHSLTEATYNIVCVEFWGCWMVRKYFPQFLSVQGNVSVLFAKL